MTHSLAAVIRLVRPFVGEVPRPGHRPNVHRLTLPPQRDGLVDERAGADGVDLKALDAVLDQLIGREVLGELGCVDLARASFVAVLARLARGGLVGVADLFSEQLAVVGVFLPERALDAVQRGGDLQTVADAETYDPGLVKFTQVSK